MKGPMYKSWIAAPVVGAFVFIFFMIGLAKIFPFMIAQLILWSSLLGFVIWVVKYLDENSSH